MWYIQLNTSSTSLYITSRDPTTERLTAIVVDNLEVVGEGMTPYKEEEDLDNDESEKRVGHNGLDVVSDVRSLTAVCQLHDIHWSTMLHPREAQESKQEAELAEPLHKAHILLDDESTKASMLAFSDLRKIKLIGSHTRRKNVGVGMMGLNVDPDNEICVDSLMLLN